MPDTSTSTLTEVSPTPPAQINAPDMPEEKRSHGPTSVDSTQDERSARRRIAAPPALRNLGPRRASAVYLWAGFVVLFGLLKPGVYLSSVTLQLIFSEGAVTCLVALAFLVPLIAGAYDLSVGALMSTSVVIGIWLQLHTSLPPVLG